MLIFVLVPALKGIFRSRTARFLGLLGLWTVPALVSAGQIFSSLESLGREPSWPYLFAVQLAIWYPWVVVTPLVFGLARRFPFARSRRWRALAVHLGAAAAVAAVYQLYTLALEMVLRPGALPPIGSGEFLALASLWIGRGLFLSFPIYWLLLGVALTLALARRYRRFELERSELATRNAQLEASLSQARLEALKRQLRPHFLFNALNAVSGLLESEPRTARQMLADLSGLLRLSIDADSSQHVDLAQELEHLSRYLAIEERRFADRLTVEYDIDDAALAGDVPALILQPLVENAVHHGIARVSTPGRILIRAERDNGLLRLEVEDDGPGLTSDAPAEGVGIANTRQRLEELYGDDHRLTFENGTTGGFRVRLTLPWSTTGPA